MKLIPVETMPMTDRYQLLWDWLAERTADKTINISHSQMPTWEQHCRFIDNNPYRYWDFIVISDLVVGHVSANHQNEVGIYIEQEHRQRGIGTSALRMFISQYEPLPASASVRVGCWVANINPANKRSQHLFESMGFEHVQNTYALKR